MCAYTSITAKLRNVKKDNDTLLTVFYIFQWNDFVSEIFYELKTFDPANHNLIINKNIMMLTNIDVFFIFS